MLARTIETEFADWIAQHAQQTDEAGRRQAGYNGQLPQREITTGVGPDKVQQSRVLDRRSKNEAGPFSSKALPP